MTNRISKVYALSASGLLIAAGVLLPYVCAHGIGVQGTVFLPMHIPVFLAGLLCGPLYGVVCGALVPALNALLTGMPAFYPALPLMTAELCVYGLASGLIYNKTPLKDKRFGVYPALLCAMLLGRAAYGALFSLLLLANPGMRGLSVITALVTGLPGIALQFIVIPPVIAALRGIKRRRGQDALASAINLIREESASCVIIRDDKIIKTALGRGVQPLLTLYEEGALSDACVADKIVGKAASMILVLGGAREAYGLTISRAALDYLKQHGVRAGGGRVIDTISNREGNGICPMERAVLDIDDPQEGLRALQDTLSALRKARA